MNHGVNGEAQHSETQHSTAQHSGAGKSSRRMTPAQLGVVEILRIVRISSRRKLSFPAALGASVYRRSAGLLAQGAHQCIWISSEGVSQLGQNGSLDDGGGG